NTVEESAKIFDNILSGKGTPEQDAVVIANAGAALKTADPKLEFPEALAKAEESLKGGKAKEVFQKLVNPKTSISFS
ncbi:MAG: anthranilate phosphoribosyltransferase, partial [Cyclobacteriaceae bacterium]|nr:anthranilate phosphoribosyltransferase [Cyclobacteriaceae bacterium]